MPVKSTTKRRPRSKVSTEEVTDHEARRVELEIAQHHFPKRMTVICDVLGDDPDWSFGPRSMETYELARLICDDLALIGEFVR